MENGLGLTTESGLLGVVTSLSLGVQGIFALLVLGHLVQFVSSAVLGRAVSLT